MLAVRSPSDAGTDLELLGQNALLTLLLLILFAFPATLFNSTLEAHYDEVRSWFGFTRPATSMLERLFASPARRWLSLGGFTVIAASLYGLLDPGFGVDRGSLALIAGLAIAILVITAAAEVSTLLFVRRRHGEPGILRVLPGSLLVGIICVSLSRLAHFEPGYLYGLVAAAQFRKPLTKRDEGRAVAVASLIVLVLSVGAWLAWIPVQVDAAAEGASFGVLVLDAALAATFVAGLEVLAIGLLPLRFLDGDKLRAWNKGVWLVLMSVGMFAFVHLLLHPEKGIVSSFGDSSLKLVIGLALAFGWFSMSFWAYFRYRRPRAVV